MADENTQPKKSLANSDLPRIRTYAADMSRAIQSRGETLTSIVAAQQEAGARFKEQETKPLSPQRMRLLVGGALAFLVVGVGLVVFAVVSRDQSNVSSEYEIPQGIIFANSTHELLIERDELVIPSFAEERRSASLSLGEIERIIPFRNEVPIPPQELATLLGLPAPLTREVVEIMVGIHSFDRNQPFIIIRTNAYERSFNALLEWEKDAGRTLGIFFKPVYAESSFAPALTFTDDVIRNVDVRKSQEAWPILYTFPERTLLIITTNEFTLREIMSRLSSGRIPAP